MKIDELLDTVVPAFAADPLFTWLFPTGDERGMRWFHTMLLQPSLLGGELVAPPGGVCAFIAPGGRWSAFDLARFVRDGGARVPWRSLPRLLQCARFLKWLGASHPREPHYHLQVLAIHPRAQGRGLGRDLLVGLAARADAERRAVYLETTNPVNLPFYRRHGFVMTGELRFGAMPPLWTMVRPPK